jgi:hypothetical protein
MNGGAFGVGRGCCGKEGRIKSLADGQLPSAKAELYVVPAGFSACITQITLVNGSGSDRTVNIYFKAKGGTSRRIFPADLTLSNGSAAYWGDYDIMGMEEGDSIEGDASAATAVDYTITGAEHR